MRTEKNTSAQKHIYHRHNLQQGKHIQLWQAAIRSGAIYCGAGHRPARQVAVQSIQRQLIGEGSNVCNGGREQESPPAALFQGSLSSMALAEAGWYGGARKDKIELLCLWGEQLHTFTAPLCPFWSPKASIFTCKAVSFIVMESIFRLIVLIESIFRLIVSVSMLTALPTASITTGSLVRLWTAVPIF